MMALSQKELKPLMVSRSILIGDGRQIKGKFNRDPSDYKYRYYDKDPVLLLKPTL